MASRMSRLAKFPRSVWEWGKKTAGDYRDVFKETGEYCVESPVSASRNFAAAAFVGYLAMSNATEYDYNNAVTENSNKLRMLAEKQRNPRSEGYIAKLELAQYNHTLTYKNLVFFGVVMIDPEPQQLKSYRAEYNLNKSYWSGIPSRTVDVSIAGYFPNMERHMIDFDIYDFDPNTYTE